MSGRLPFNAANLRKKQESKQAKSASDGVLSVSALASILDTAIRSGTPPTLRVLGEVSGFRERTHWYFDLKDASAVVQCVVFAGNARKLGFVPEDGQEVVASGRVDYYAKSGKVSLIATRLEPVGAGALDLAYQKLVEELRGLGWFDDERKRALPIFPRRIAVVTSRSSAGLQDVLDTARRRCAAVEILTVDVRVQGDGAAAEITKAVSLLSRRHVELGLDAILLTRGGGSKEDLWCFNVRDLAEAIVTCDIPVVAAIGHETDTTIAELVADLRGATPTQAAMRLIPDAGAIGEQLDRQGARLQTALNRASSQSRAQLQSIESRTIFRRPGELVAIHRAPLDACAQQLEHLVRAKYHQQDVRLERLASRLDRVRPDRLASRLDRQRAARLATMTERFQRVTRSQLERAGLSLASAERELAAVSPLAVLARGYSVTFDAAGNAVRKAADLAPGDTIQTRLPDGSVRSVVEGRPAKPRPKPSPQSEPKADEADQMDLFDAER